MNIIIQNQSKADIFTYIFQYIKNFSDQINIIFEQERLYIQTMDSGHVSIFELVLPSAWFDEYTIGSENLTIGVSSSLLYKILNARDKQQIINIVTDDETLLVHFTGLDKTTFDKHFEIPLINIDSDLLAVPLIEYQAEFSVSSAHFASIISQLKIFGDNMLLKCSEDMIGLYANSLENGKMFVEIKIEDLTSYAIEEGETLESSFSINYLHNICLYNKLSKEIEVLFSRDYPLKLIYLLGEKDSPDLGKMTFYLAPRVDND